MVRKMSSTVGPDLNWPRVRSAGTMAKPESSFSPAAFSPSPLPALPWHSQHFASCQTSLPAIEHLPAWAGGLADGERRAGRLLDEEA